MGVRLPPMQALRAFEAAAREGSLTRAAEALNVTHGAISHQIKSLEADLGVRLTERAGRGIRLTDEGERFASRVRAAFAELTAAVNEITARVNPRLLRVSVVAVVRRALAVAADRRAFSQHIRMSISTCDPTCRTSISSATTPMSLSGMATAIGRA